MKRSPALAGSVLLIISLAGASCQAAYTPPTRSRLDSLVERNVDRIRTQFSAQCDSDIYRLARAKADSILRVGGK